MKKFLFAAAFTTAVSFQLAATTDLLLPEKPVTIKIGNERDGFTDSVTGFARYTNNKVIQSSCAVLPFMVFIPEQNKIVYTFGAGYPWKLKVLESTDNGRTYTESSFGNHPRGSCVGLTYYGNGVMTSENGHARSTDYGKSWKWTEYVHEPRFSGLPTGWAADYVFPDSNGKHILSAFYVNRHFQYPEAKQISILKESFDGGETWSDYRGIPEFYGANEVAFCDNAKGEIIAAIRATTLMAPSNDQSDRLEVAISKDGGKSWSAPKVVAGNGRHHPTMVRLPDGRIVMSYVVRSGYRSDKKGYHYGIEAVISHDGGYTWDTDHRYILAEWAHDGKVKDVVTGQNAYMEQFYMAPQTTGMLYLPQSDEILTTYMTAGNLAEKNGRITYPRECVIVRWKPLNTYSGKKAPRRPPIPAEQALKELRQCPYWSINYLSATGKPDGGWKNCYPRQSVSLNKRVLRLDHRVTEGQYMFRGIDHLEFMTDIVYFRTKLNLLSVPDPHASERLTIYACIGNGQDKYQLALFFNADNSVSGTFGKIPLPIKTDKEFLFEMHLDPLAQRARIWVDDKLIYDKPWIVKYADPNLPACFYFGKGTSRTGGMVEVREMRLGEKVIFPDKK